MKKLVFDTTDVNTIADSDSVGAFLRASDGTLLTHTDVGGKKALDVRIAEGINVEVDLDHTDDSVTAHQGGTWTIDSITNDVNVTATDLDIRDLSSATDSIAAVQSGAWDVSVNSLPADIDIRDLSHTQDSIKVGDGTDLLAVEADGSINVNVASIQDAALADTAIANAAFSLASANLAQDLVASPLANRKYLYAYNNDNRTGYIGANGVTSANGFPVPPNAMVELRAGASIDIEFVSPKSGHDVRTLELS